MSGAENQRNEPERVKGENLGLKVDLVVNEIEKDRDREYPAKFINSLKEKNPKLYQNLKEINLDTNDFEQKLKDARSALDKALLDTEKEILIKDAIAHPENYCAWDMPTQKWTMKFAPNSPADKFLQIQHIIPEKYKDGTFYLTKGSDATQYKWDSKKNPLSFYNGNNRLLIRSGDVVKVDKITQEAPVAEKAAIPSDEDGPVVSVEEIDASSEQRAKEYIVNKYFVKPPNNPNDDAQISEKYQEACRTAVANITDFSQESSGNAVKSTFKYKGIPMELSAEGMVTKLSVTYTDGKREYTNDTTKNEFSNITELINTHEREVFAASVLKEFGITDKPSKVIMNTVGDKHRTPNAIAIFKFDNYSLDYGAKDAGDNDAQTLTLYNSANEKVATLAKGDSINIKELLAKNAQEKADKAVAALKKDIAEDWGLTAENIHPIKITENEISFDYGSGTSKKHATIFDKNTDKRQIRWSDASATA